MRYTRSRTRMGHFASSRLISRMYWIRFIWLLLSVGIPYFTIFVVGKIVERCRRGEGIECKKAGVLQLLLFWFFDFVYFCFWLVFRATSIAGKRRDVLKLLLFPNVPVVSSDAPCQFLVFVLPRQQFSRVDADQLADGVLDLHAPVLFPLILVGILGRFVWRGCVYNLLDYLRLVV